VQWQQQQAPKRFDVATHFARPRLRSPGLLSPSSSRYHGNSRYDTNSGYGGNQHHQGHHHDPASAGNRPRRARLRRLGRNGDRR